MKRVVVLLSGSGTLAQSLITAGRLPDSVFQVVAVGSDLPDALGLMRAADAGIEHFVVEMLPDRKAWNIELAETVARYQPDLVVSAGFMRIVGTDFLDLFGGRFINSHPALLPSFPGAHGVRDALAAGVKVTGTTIFMVDSGVDTGRIIAQEPVRVLDEDTEQTLHERIKVVERDLLVQVVTQLLSEENHG